MKETRAEHLAVEKLRPFEGHPFKVVDDEEMDQLTWSILTQGLLTPLVVRPLDKRITPPAWVFAIVMKTACCRVSATTSPKR